MQEHTEDEDEEQSKPEGRHCLPERREGPGRVVELAPPSNSGVDTDREGYHDHDEHGQTA